MKTIIALGFDCLWLFVIGGLLGVLIENVWWKLRYGFFQSHVSLLWSPLCTIYGFGAAGCYLGSLLLTGRSAITKFLAYALVGTAIEFIGGWLLDAGLNARAWDYSGSFLNIRGYVSAGMTLMWGALGLGFDALIPAFKPMLDALRTPEWYFAGALLAVFLAADTIATSLCLVRWSRRHAGVKAHNPLERFIDRRCPDSRMRKRFNNWHFNDEPDTARSKAAASSTVLTG